MGSVLLFALIAAILFVAWAVWWVTGRGGQTSRQRYGPSGVRGVVAICTQAELVFFRTLESAVPPTMRVLCKVRVADVIKTFGTDFRTISQKHFDFVVCEAESLLPLLVIELDDNSHLSPAAQQRDAVKDAICLAAGLPMIRVVAASSYEPAEIAAWIGEALEKVPG